MAIGETGLITKLINRGPQSGLENDVDDRLRGEASFSSIPSGPSGALPSYFLSSAKRAGALLGVALSEPVLLPRTGKTVNKSEAGHAFVVPNKILQGALELYLGSGEPLHSDPSWHQIVDPISLSSPEIAFQVVSPYRHLNEATQEVADYPEHQVFDLESLVEWFKINPCSPLTNGKLLFPLQIAPNLAVTNLLRSEMVPKRDLLTRTDERALVAFCKEASGALNDQLAPSILTKLRRHTMSSKIICTALYGLGLSSPLIASAIIIYRTRAQTQKPSEYGFRADAANSPFVYAHAPDDFPRKHAWSAPWILYGCDPAPGACEQTSIRYLSYDGLDRYLPAKWPEFAQASSQKMLSGRELSQLCLDVQARCTPGYAGLNIAAQEFNWSEGDSLADLILSLGFIGAAIIFIISGRLWDRGYRAPRVPTFRLPSDFQ